MALHLRRSIRRSVCALAAGFFAACTGPGGAPLDPGPGDAGPQDVGTLHGGVEDAGRPDAGRPDAGPRDPLQGVAAPTLVRDGYRFTEGAAWRGAGHFVFVDLGPDTLFEVDLSGTVRVQRPRLGGAVGLAEDATGALIVAGHWARNLTVVRDGALPEVLVDAFEGAPLNSPNDLVLADGGRIYFTDPPFGIDPEDRALDFHGVFRLEPDGALTAEYRAPTSFAPNGIERSPDGRTLYVADSWGSAVHRFEVQPDGRLGPPARFVETGRGPDGLAVDAEGNLYVASLSGVEVFAPDGAPWGTLELPDEPTNLAFGGPEGRTLLITAVSGVYWAEAHVPGRPGP